MNTKLIESLWWKAQMGYNDQQCDPEVVANFTRLVIEECLTACRSRIGPQEYNTGRMHCASDIIDHFKG